MNTTLAEFLTQRKAQIKAQIVALKKELQSIQAAEDAIVTDDEEDTVGATGTRRSSTRITIKTMVVAALRNKQNGGDAHEIIKAIKEQYGKDIPRPSMSPQLSRLKDDGYLELRNGNWCLTEKAQKESAPEGADSEGHNLV